MAKPGGDPRTGDVRPRRQRRFRRVHEFGNFGARLRSRRVGAQRAQIPQPGKSQQMGGQGRRGVGGRERAWGEFQHRPKIFQFRFHDAGAAAGVAWPWVAHRQSGRIGRIGGTEILQFREQAARAAGQAARLAHPALSEKAGYGAGTALRMAVIAAA
jgi:hypothetical protein